MQIWSDLVYVMVEGFLGGWAFFFFFSRGIYICGYGLLLEQLNLGFWVYIWILHLVLEREGEKREKKKSSGIHTLGSRAVHLENFVTHRPGGSSATSSSPSRIRLSSFAWHHYHRPTSMHPG